MSRVNPLFDPAFVQKHLVPERSYEFCVEFARQLRCRIKYVPTINEAIRLLKRPDLLLPWFGDMDPYTGWYVDNIYNENTSWFSDGSYHPEMLFINPRKKYHQDLDVWVGSSGTCDAGLGKRYMRPVYRNHLGQFPSWAYTPHYRPYNKTTSGLREGGLSDRRIQVNKGYAYNDLSSRKDYKYKSGLKNIHQ